MQTQERSPCRRKGGQAASSRSSERAKLRRRRHPQATFKDYFAAIAKDDLARGRQHPSLGEHLKWGQLAARPTSPRGGGILKRWVRFVLTPQGFSSLLPPEGMSRQFSAQRPLKLAPTKQNQSIEGPATKSSQAVGDRLVVAIRQMFKFPRLLKEYYLSQKI
jgi:hypothetical protein